MPDFQRQVSLQPFNTFSVAATADRYLKITDASQLEGLLPLNIEDHVLVLGGGSNILFVDPEFDGLILHVDLKGISVDQQSDSEVLVTAMAGENWHDFVTWCVEQNYGGIENLSLIPGRVGAAPVQNIGAYGVELKDVLQSVDAIQLYSGKRQQFSIDECNMGYRDSRFKSAEPGEWLIISVTLKLTCNNHAIKTEYGAIQRQLEAMGVGAPSIGDVRQAVIAIRQQRLPDPKEIPNAGSFFKNPVMSVSQYEDLHRQFSELPGYPLSETHIKVPAGWLIEQCGWKGKQKDGCGVHDQHALVLVNSDNASGQQLVELSHEVAASVLSRFGIQLTPEVNVIE